MTREDEVAEAIAQLLAKNVMDCHWTEEGLAFTGEQQEFCQGLCGCSCRPFKPYRVMKKAKLRLLRLIDEHRSACFDRALGVEAQEKP